MDGLTKTNELVFVQLCYAVLLLIFCAAATNLPWELDAAMLRRLEKRIEKQEETCLKNWLLPGNGGEELPYDILIEKTEGFSGSDIRLVCKEAAMQPLRRVMTILENQDEIVPEDELPKVGPILPEDIETALKNTRPSAHMHADRYEKFNSNYGSQILQ